LEEGVYSIQKAQQLLTFLKKHYNGIVYSVIHLYVGPTHIDVDVIFQHDING